MDKRVKGTKGLYFQIACGGLIVNHKHLMYNPTVAWIGIALYRSSSPVSYSKLTC